MSLLTGQAIVRGIERGTIRVSDFDRDCVNPCSLDLRLGDTYSYYTSRDVRYLDVTKQCAVETYPIAENGWVLNPGMLYLMHTKESVYSSKYAILLGGKSSLARLGLQVHVTAGLVEPGFEGQITLEVTCMHSIKVVPNMRICQIVFETLEGDIDMYDGHYVGDTARGPQASLAWKQCEEDRRRGNL